MKKVKLTELSEAIRSFLSQVKDGEPVWVEDEQGRARYGVIFYPEASPEDMQRADEWFERIRQQVGTSMAEQGITEDDVIQEVLKDD